MSNQRRQPSVRISDVSGSNINIAGGDINQVIANGDYMGGDKNIQIVFGRIRREIEKLPDGIEKQEANETLDKLEAESHKGDQANENRVERWFKFLAETAPDAWDVAVKTFINPIDGVGEVFRKVAQRANKK